MIRSVVLAKLKAGYDAAELSSIQDGLRNLNTPGTVRYTIGIDAGLRDGNWDYVIVADFEDVDSYRNYDEDAAHKALRARLAPFVEQIARAQFEIPDA
ncbi:stress protein [Enterococcus faecium]|nr:stress protein [Enterococcus faecium]